MKSDVVFCQLSEQTQDLLRTSREIFDKEVERIIADQREQGDHLYDLLFKRAGITDPYLRGAKRHQQALESGESSIADLAQYFDQEIQDLKDHYNETNSAIHFWGLHRGDCDQE